ncbi:hypothetical protein GH714_017767 [Hevea brasiliensis]|uniref:Cyanate lyase C-terminal domain-containing protein n=1 Tax=Hevea brasiliensis TaxID=3981 RepID=A0A6A6K6E4_HEVBR|nr:hypothetical protein GH714_017767 [Hevea brasiliensis]
MSKTFTPETIETKSEISKRLLDVKKRLNEAVMHFGESIKEIINEEFGDGIMSAIDFYCSVDKVKGVDGKDRVVVTFDGKYLPHTEQCTHRTLPVTSGDLATWKAYANWLDEQRRVVLVCDATDPHPTAYIHDHKACPTDDAKNPN